jgi:PAS domain S-box-containing protein
MSLEVQRVLLVEDNQADSLIVRDLLMDIEGVQVEVEWVQTYDEALISLQRGNYDVCFLDYCLGMRNGLELLQELSKENPIPIIVLTGNEDHRIDEAVSSAGAVDYLVKSRINSNLLERSIRYAIERKASENFLLQAKLLAQSIVDSLPQKVAVLNSEGIIVAVNSAWVEANGTDCFMGADAEIGVNYLARCQAGKTEEIRALAEDIERVISGDSGQNLRHREYRCTYSGEERWFECRITPLKNHQPLLVMVAHENVSERKKAEVKLRISEANLANAQRMASLGSWEVEIDSGASGGPGKSYWSEETFRILGYEPDKVEANSENGARVLSENDLALFEKHMAETVAQQKPFMLEHRIFRADGSQRWVQNQVHLAVDAQGNPEKLIGTVQDVTERREAEEKLQFQQTLLEAQAEASIDGILAVSDEGEILSFNQRFAQIWGFSRELLEQRRDGLIVEEVLTKVKDPDHFIERVTYLYGHKEEKSQDEILLLDGRVLDRYSAPILDKNGQGYGRVWYFRDVTERKNSELALEQSNREILTIWESMSDGFYAVDREWRFTHINSQAAALLHIDASTIIGKNLWDEFPAARDLSFYPIYHRVVEEQIPVVFEEYFEPLDMWVEVHAYPSPLGVSVYFRDATERKRSEQALRASEARFQGIVANAPGMVYQFLLYPDGSMKFPFVSEGSLELFGVEPAAIREDPMQLLKLIHPEDLSGYERSVNEAILTMEPWRWEGRGRLKSGEMKWIQGVSHPRQMPDGSTIWDGLLIDITDRKAAEDERDRFFTLSRDMLAIVDSNGYYKRFNAAFESMLGYSATEIANVAPIDLVHPDDRAATMVEAEKLIAGATEVSFVNRNICKNGESIWLSWHVVKSESLHYAVAHNITPVVEAEAALRRANEELEQRVAERTAELASANEDLRVENVERQMTMAALRQVAEAYRVAKEESDSASRAKSEFLSRMSHELRTPLNAILGFGQILQGNGLSGEENEHVNQILNGGWHLLDLINEVLDIARVETGNLDISLEAVSLPEVMAESCALVSPLAAQRNIKLDSSGISGLNCNVMADRQRLKQVFINLISNGIKYNRQDGQVRLSCLATAEGRVRIGVSDNGVGMSAQDQEKLFIPFERLNAADSDIEGTGLGLVLSKHLLVAMGGQLEVESQTGVGSTFWVDLAQAQEGLKVAEDAPATVVTASPYDQAGRIYSVLSIEDSGSNQHLLQEILSSRPQVRLMGAALGRVGVHLAGEHLPDLILLNLNLPDISGQVVLDLLQQHPATARIPVIVVSADATPVQIERLLAAGATDYLTKPYNVAKLLTALDQALLAAPAKRVTAPAVAAAEAPSIETEKSQAPRSLRVLVAEDNLVNQKVVSFQLRKLGHEPFLYADGEAVVKAWQEGNYDLILMDCHMPVLDGYAATREIRHLEAGKAHIPIVALTANALAEDRERSLASGMDDHLSKPIKQAELASALSRWFEDV